MKTVYMKQVYMGMIGDMKNLEQHYSRMAEQGWMIDKIGTFTHRYRAIEPCKKCFFVDFLPQISTFDYPENETAQDYRAICEASGWTFITANKQFHVFCADNDAPTPMPIHTDNKIEAQIYLKASKKYELPWMIYAMVMLLLASPFNRGAEVLLSNIALFYGLGLISFLIPWVWTFLFMICWFLRTRKSAKNGLPMPDVNYRLARARINMFTLGTILFLVFTITGIVLEIIGGKGISIILMLLIPFSGLGVGLWVRRQVDTKRRTRAGNIRLLVISIIILEIFVIVGLAFMAHNILTSQSTNPDTLNELPTLTLSDIGITTEPENSGAQINGSIIVPVDCEIWEAGEGRISTHMYRLVNNTLAQWLYEHLANEYTDELEVQIKNGDNLSGYVVSLSSDEAASLGAEKGISFKYTNNNIIELLLHNDKTILRISAESKLIDFEEFNQAVRELWKKINTL